MRRNKVIAGVSALLFGAFGVHKFYLGGWGWGIVYIVFAWTGIPLIVSFIEGVTILLMDVAEFDQKYNSGIRHPFIW